MRDTSNDLEVYTPPQPDGFEMKPRTLDEAMKFCEIMANSDLVPSGYKGKPGNIMVAIQMGNELGMTPMRALRSIAVINGRASIWGDDMLAMVLASPVCEYVNEADSTDREGVCRTKRKGCEEQVSRFTLEDAKRAGLLGKQGPWQTNTSRMLKLRARGFGLRDTFADVLAGLVSTEEALDRPQTDDPETVPEPIHLTTLKEKLKAKVLETTVDVTPTEPAQGDGLGVQGASNTAEYRTTLQQVQDAPAPSSYAQGYLDKLHASTVLKDAVNLMNDILFDKNLTAEDQTLLKEYGAKKIAELKRKK